MFNFCESFDSEDLAQTSCDTLEEETGCLLQGGVYVGISDPRRYPQGSDKISMDILGIDKFA